jgi:hypothetical protein
MWIRLNDSQIATLKKLLPRIKRPGRHKASLRSLIKALADREAEDKNPALQACVAKAKEQYHRDGECEINEDAVVSPGSDPGAYVMAWVWVYDDEKEEEDDDEEEG